MLFSLSDEWQTHQHPCSAIRDRSNRTASPQLFCPFTHGRETNPTPLEWWEAVPIVTNLQDQVFIDAEMDATSLGMGMAHDIGECFLRDSIAGDFHSGWKGRQAFWGSEGEGEAASRPRSSRAGGRNA